MSVKGNIAASLLLFVLFVAYGLGAMTIPMFPGQEFEPFKPRTMPSLASYHTALSGEDIRTTRRQQSVARWWSSREEPAS